MLENLLIGLGCALFFVVLEVLTKPKVVPEYEYGVFRYGQRARRDKSSGAVQFVLFKAGEQGHIEDCWYDSDSSWWDTFTPT